MKLERGYAQHVGSRQEQQDAALLLSDDGQTLIVIADGMGGHAGGSIASAQVAETAKEVWAEHKKSRLEPKRLLERIIREGHEAINKAGAEKGLTPRSTCAMLYVDDRAAQWAHVGDSRIYRLRDGQLQRLTRDHSVVQMLVDLGKVAEEEMGTHPDQNRLTQSLGGDAAPMPDFGNDALKSHDAFLVCSDGLWEMIPQSEMTATLGAKKLGDDGARLLADRAFDRAKPKSDNISVALLRVDGPPPGAVAAPDEADTARGQQLRRTGSARWLFAATTVVAIGAAAAIVYKPWDAKHADSESVPPKAKPDDRTGTDPKSTEPKKPEEDPKPQPAERREAPPPPPQRPPEAKPPATPAPEQPKAQPNPGAQPGDPPKPAPPAQPPGDQPPKPSTPPSDGSTDKKPSEGGTDKKPADGGDQRQVAPQRQELHPSGLTPPGTPETPNRP